MRRSRGEHEAQSHERWLVSYADFITLLFAFFVVLYASSQSDRHKVMKAAESVRRAFDGPPKVARVLGGTVEDVGQGSNMMRGAGGAKAGVLEAPADLLATDELLKESLADDIHAGRINIHSETRGLVVSLQEAAYFVSGDDEVSAAGIPVLRRRWKKSQIRFASKDTPIVCPSTIRGSIAIGSFRRPAVSPCWRPCAPSFRSKADECPWWATQTPFPWTPTTRWKGARRTGAWIS
jgi:hypothetical protein